MIHKDHTWLNVSRGYSVSYMVQFDRFNDYVAFCFDTILGHIFYQKACIQR